MDMGHVSTVKKTVKEKVADWLLLSAMPLLVAGMTLLLSVAS